ncbi:Os11g0220550, partial [Oryza sativa Japonica Group]
MAEPLVLDDDEHHGEQRRREGGGVADVERPVPVRVLPPLQHRVAGDVLPAHGGVPPESPRRVHPRHVRDRRREDGQQQQDLVLRLHRLGCCRILVSWRRRPRRRRWRRCSFLTRQLPSDGDEIEGGEEGAGDVGEDEEEEGGGGGGGEPVSAAAGGVGAHEAEQVDHHHRAHGAEQPAAAFLGEDEHDEAHHQRRRERHRVAGVEHDVPRVPRLPEDGVAGDHPQPGRRRRVLLPGPARQVQPRRVRHRRHQRRQQQQVLPQPVLRRLLLRR